MNFRTNESFIELIVFVHFYYFKDIQEDCLDQTFWQPIHTKYNDTSFSFHFLFFFYSRSFGVAIDFREIKNQALKIS